MEFFESAGFACPERKGVADFLQEVTSRKDQQVSLSFKIVWLHLGKYVLKRPHGKLMNLEKGCV